ncbi:MAG: hypothetical protein AAF620_17995 [Bacteroidota bacterium]
MGKYLNIDIREELVTITSKAREYVLSYVKDKTVLFYFDQKRDSVLLERLGLNYDFSFSKIRERLLSQGAKRAEKVKPVSLDLPPL